MDLRFLLLFLVVPSLLGEEDYASTCPEKFTCGNLSALEFPFSNGTLSDCGLLYLDCTRTPRTIKLDLNPWSEAFEVINISESNNVIKLRDPKFLALGKRGVCHILAFYDLRLQNSASISFTITSNVTLLKCSNTPPPSQDGYTQIKSCEDMNTYYTVPKHNGSQIPPDPQLSGCSAIQLPIRQVDEIPNDSTLLDLLTADFDLQWNISDECNKCHNRGGLCLTDEKNQSPCSIEERRKDKKIPKVIVGTAALIGVISLLIIIFLFRNQFSICNSVERCKNQDIEIFLKECGSLAPKRYHYKDVKTMTNSFKLELGQGGYGSVYKGTMQDGSLVAVKVLKESKGNGQDFINEVSSISRTSHVNIVTLLGYCIEGQKTALIYEFMANGSLEKFIYGEQPSMNRQLEWSTLYKIAVGIARGLEYLHRGCNTRILHFDIKPRNILLDENFCPKISDFGLAKLCTRKESIISTMCARGTIGYIAPEIVCKNIGGISHKSDVYSYGMMVLEMVGGRKNLDVGVDHTSEIYFPHWIYRRLDQGEELCLSGIMDAEEDKQARKMLMVSLGAYKLIHHLVQ